MQLKEKPELNKIKQKSEASVKTYQPDRSIKEPKSVARVDRTNLQPIKEPKSVATVDRTNLQPLKEPKPVPITQWPDLPPLKERKSVVTTVDMQPKEKLDLNQINQRLEVFVKTYRQDFQPIKEPKSVPTTDRQDLRSIKNRKSVATTYQPYLPIIKEYQSGGGTSRIIDFFVVVIIIGILAQIALPSFLSCGNKARQSEGKQYVASMNKGQQAYFGENSAFGNSISALGLGIKTQTTNYNYSAIATKNAAFSYAVSRNNNLRSYVGAVFLVPVSQESYHATTTASILCKTNAFGKNIQPSNPILQNGVPVCGDGTVEVSK